MVVFGWVMIMLMDRSDNEPLDYALMLVVWAIPFLTAPMGMSVVLPYRSCQTWLSGRDCSGGSGSKSIALN